MKKMRMCFPKAKKKRAKWLHFGNQCGKIISPNKPNNDEQIVVCQGGSIPFSPISEFAKNAIPQVGVLGQYYYCSCSDLVCLATIGVAFLSALTSVGALFIFLRKKEETMKDKTTAIILSALLGRLGVDRFYLGYTGMGVLKLLTGGCFGILWILDIINIATGKLQPADGSCYEGEVVSTSQQASTTDSLEKLKKLNELREAGALNEVEFSAMKAECLRQKTADVVKKSIKPENIFEYTFEAE